jgi:hypothetical protein
MDRFELDVHQGGFDQDWSFFRNIMKNFLKLPHGFGDIFRTRRYIKSISGSCSLDPVLGTTEFAGVLVASPSFYNQYLVDLPNQAIGEREFFSESFQAMVHGGDIIRDLDDIIKRHTRGLFPFEQQEVGKWRLRPFDLRRKDRLLADKYVKKKINIRQKRCDAVQAPQRNKGLVNGFPKEGINGQRRLWRKWGGNKRPVPLISKLGDAGLA